MPVILKAYPISLGFGAGRGGSIWPGGPDRHEIGCAALALAGLDKSTHAAPPSRVRPGAAAGRLDPRISSLGVDHDPFAMDDVLTLTDHDIAAQRDGLGLEIVNAEVAAGALIFGEHCDSTPRFNAADILSALRSAELRFRGRARVCFP